MQAFIRNIHWCLGTILLLSGSIAAQANSSQARIFQMLVQDFEARYPFLPDQRAQWQRQLPALQQRAGAAESEEELWTILLDLLRPLEDRHVSLQAPRFGTFRSGEGGPRGETPPGLRDTGTIGDAVSFGTRGDGVLYLRIHHFRGTLESARWTGTLDALLRKYAKAPGVLVDVRDNDGGNHRVAGHVAEAFAHRRRHYLTIREHSPAGHRPGEEKWYLRPRGIFPTGRPVTVWTNRNTASAAEAFVLAMRTLPNVTHKGERTAGASGDMDTRTLPNGWRYTLPTNSFYTSDGQPLAIQGIRPP